NAPNCRDRCMICSRLTDEPNTSICRMFLCAFLAGRGTPTTRCPGCAGTTTGRSPVLRFQEAAVPLTFAVARARTGCCPASPVPVWAFQVTSTPNDVDRAQHFSESGHVGLDKARRLLLQGPHALRTGSLEQLVVRCPIQDQLPDGLRHGHQLVHP